MGPLKTADKSEDLWHETSGEGGGGISRRGWFGLGLDLPGESRE